MNKFMTNKIKNESDQEILLITQEECAEVTQAISKVFRFGMDDEYNGVTNREHLEEELGDLLCFTLSLVRRSDFGGGSTVCRGSQKHTIM